MKTAAARPVFRTKKKSGGLHCRRCQGLMLPERLYADTLGLGPMDCWGWRCLVCGEFIDPLILHHRVRPAGSFIHHKEVRHEHAHTLGSASQ